MQRPAPQIAFVREGEDFPAISSPTAATSAAKSVGPLSMPSPSAKRTKPVIFAGAPISFSASFSAFSTVRSGLSTKACFRSTTSS